MGRAVEPDLQHRWSIILAGGDGSRLKEYTKRLYPDGRPKQFCALDAGPRTMLERTLERALLFSNEHHTLIAALRRHSPWHNLPEFAGVLWSVEPVAAGTGTAVLLAALEVRWRDPAATLAIFPADHYVSDDFRFVTYVHHAATWVDDHPDDVVLLGVEPDRPESEFGWLVPAEPAQPPPMPARLVEKPGSAEAERLQASGALWNTSVAVCALPALLRLFQALAPRHSVALSGAFRQGPDSLEHVFKPLPKLDLSRDILARSPDRLRVLPVRGVVWADWGTEGRIRDTLDGLPAVPDKAAQA